MRGGVLPLCCLVSLLLLTTAQDVELNRGNSEALAAIHAALKIITSRVSTVNSTDPSWLDLASKYGSGALSPPSDGNCWPFNGPPAFPRRDELTRGGTLDRWLSTSTANIGAERFSIYASGTKPATGTIIPNGEGVTGQSYDLLMGVFDVISQFYNVKIEPVVWYFDWCEAEEGCASAAPTLLNVRLREGVIDLAYGGIGYQEARDEYVDYGCFGASERLLLVSGPLGTELTTPQNANRPSTLLCFFKGSNSINVAQRFFSDAPLLDEFTNEAQVFQAVLEGTNGCQGTFQGSASFKSDSGFNKFEFSEIERHFAVMRQDTRLGGGQLARALNAALGQTVNDGIWNAKVVQEVTAIYPTIAVTPPDGGSCPGWDSYPSTEEFIKDGLLKKIVDVGKMVIGADFTPRLPISGGPDITRVNDGALVSSSEVKGLDHLLMQEMLKKMSIKYQKTIVPEYRQYRWCQTECTPDNPILLKRVLTNRHVDIVGGGVGISKGRDAYLEYPCWTAMTREVLVKGPKAPVSFDTKEDIDKKTTIFCVPDGFGSLFLIRELYPNAQIRTEGVVAGGDDALNKVRDGIFDCMATVDDAVHYGVYAAERDPGGNTSAALLDIGRQIRYYSPTVQDGGDGFDSASSQLSISLLFVSFTAAVSAFHALYCA
mmetsp:Transcript_3298/g.8305  ORF Transcript_3298/g.8305 Transcript_3298/m.8305 type:complete len:657 (+) Transcript_3298:321-2291(+)